MAELRPQRPSIEPTEKCSRSRYTCARSTEGPRTSPVIGTMTVALLIAFACRPLKDSFDRRSNLEFAGPHAARWIVVYKVLCHSCGRPFDAEKAQDCTCLHPVRSFRCPNCAACFCDASRDYVDGFWRDAPPEVWARRKQTAVVDAE